MITKPTAMISELSFSGGDSFQFRKNEKVILVGPNNSGKSQTLREIFSISKSGKTERTLVVMDLTILKAGTRDDLKTYLDENADYVNGDYIRNNWRINELILHYWDEEYLKHNMVEGFINNIDAKNRLDICDVKNSISLDEQKKVPQHILYDDEHLMKKISDLFRQAFGKDLIINFRGGKEIPIHVGEGSELDDSDLGDRVSDSYVKKVRENPLLHEQGDGMKSYAGILFEAVVNDLDITLIDEPEAFLHPPQMRRLGETLSSEVKGQLIVSTHSSDILRGFLEGTRGNVRILRIRRDKDVNHVSEASPDVIEELWSKPELRYSNALEGIFHEQTIICEDDSDCRLINSIADHLASESDDQWQDTAYVPTGGKHGVPKVASILRKIGVPVKAVFDIDFLSEKSLVRTTVEAFGGEWDEVEPFWDRVNSAVRGGILPKSNSAIKAEIISIFEKSNDNDLPKGDVTQAMKQDKPWNKVKRYGVAGIPPGNAQGDYNSLRELLEDIGIYLIPVGEIENFCRELGSHGPKFVSKLLSDIPLGDDRLADLRVFVDKVHKGASGRSR